MGCWPITRLSAARSRWHRERYRVVGEGGSWVDYWGSVGAGCDLVVPMSDHEADARAERKAIYAKRNVFAAANSAFVSTMQQAMDAYRQARAEGVERDDAIKGLEHVIRETWARPTTKFGPTCEDCDDVGYQHFLCRQYARCERLNCNAKGEDWQHAYVRPCECPKGQRYEPRAQQVTDLAAVGKVKAKRGFSRMGR